MLQFFGRKRARKVIALRHRNPRLVEGLSLHRRLNSLADDRHWCYHTQRRQTDEPRRARVLGRDLINERLVCLDQVQFAACQHGEVGSAQRDVIERHPDTGPRRGFEGGEAQVVGYPTLGDLDDDLIPYFGQPGFRGHVLQPATPQDFRRDVDSDVSVAVGAEPVAKLLRHGFEHPIGERAREIGAFDDADELAWLDQSGRSPPPRQGLRSHTPAIGERDGGHIEELPSVSRHGRIKTQRTSHGRHHLKAPIPRLPATDDPAPLGRRSVRDALYRALS